MILSVNNLKDKWHSFPTRFFSCVILLTTTLWIAIFISISEVLSPNFFSSLMHLNLFHVLKVFWLGNYSSSTHLQFSHPALIDAIKKQKIKSIHLPPFLPLSTISFFAHVPNKISWKIILVSFSNSSIAYPCLFWKCYIY